MELYHLIRKIETKQEELKWFFCQTGSISMIKMFNSLARIR